MEWALYIKKVEELENVPAKYSRIYFGSEFCQRLIPGAKELERVFRRTQGKKMNFSFVTPYVTEERVDRLFTLFSFLDKAQMPSEIIINDWGVLEILNQKFKNLIPVLGRLLTKQKRGPTLIRLLKRRLRPKAMAMPDVQGKVIMVTPKRIPLALDAYYKGSNTGSVEIIHDFLLSRGIRRIELDNLGQGLAVDLPEGKIYASLYFPYVYITTTFFCPSAGCDNHRNLFLKIKPCRKECQKYTFELRNKSMGKVIFLKGNTQFYKNNRLQTEHWRKLGIDRVVFENNIPI